MSIGTMEGPNEYLLNRIEGAARLSDGSVVVAVGGEHELRKFGPTGEHLWTRGREGEGPGEFQRLWLLPSCTTNNVIVTYDIRLRRVTVFDVDGELVLTHPLMFADGLRPYRLGCSPSGRFVISTWGDMRADGAGAHRWEVSLAYSDGEESGIEVIREGIPGQDRVQYARDGVPTSNGPRTWGRRVAFSANADGAWIGTGDDYEIEFVDWSGVTQRKIRWVGPDVRVTPNDLEAEYSRRLASAGGRSDPTFERRWASARDNLPDHFPSYSGFLGSRDGKLWIEHYPRPSQVREWVVFDDGGTWAGKLSIPQEAVILDAGTDWVLLHLTDALGVERLAVYSFAETESSG